MNIEKFEEMPINLRGRPAVYPFEKLGPGEKLTIPIPDTELDKREYRKKVTYALSYYKRANGLAWQSAVRLEDGNVVVYRIN